MIQNGKASSRATHWIAALRSFSAERRRAAFERLCVQHLALIDELVKVVVEWSASRPSDSIEIDSPEYLAFLSLGALRAADAAPVIIDFLKVHDSSFD